ncbi:MAG: AmmeMemoRadiSam system protein B [Planctomycetaceae bacterium]|nr:AmmeMemoRadiSam system protein B [Planctomycetaceae bacterium]
MNVRKAAVAGQFYGGTRAECLEEIRDCLGAGPVQGELPRPIVGAVVPHAGWVFSGSLAAMAFKAIEQVNGQVDTFVLFGAAHSLGRGGPALYDSGEWETPLGKIGVDAELAAAIAGIGAIANPNAHKGEHSIEVQVPFIQYLFPKAQIVPIIMPAAGFDPAFGRRVGELICKQSRKIVCVGSSDLTHYGPRYGFYPEGSGPEGIRWAGEVNDKEFIELALRMEAESLVETAIEKNSACGPAAVAAVAAAAKAMGRSRGILLGHTTSSDVVREKFGQFSEESVGYAAIVY